MTSGIRSVLALASGGALGRARAARAFTAARIRHALVAAVAFAGVALVVAGVALIYAPLGLIVAGLSVLAAVTFDPNRVRKVTWPR